MPVVTSDLRIDPTLRSFVVDELLPGLDLDPDRFWAALADLQDRFAGRIAELLARRDELQAQIDAWHREHGRRRPGRLRRVPHRDRLPGAGRGRAPAASTGVDPEIAEVAGPQLVVPATVPRYALNAANARWGSLFDAFYGTDALPQDHELAPGYDEQRGAQVIAAADELLDELFPLADGQPRRRHGVPRATDGGRWCPALADPGQFAGSADGRRSCCAATACTSS